MEKIKHYYNLFIGKDKELINNYGECLIAAFGLGSPFFIFTICVVAGIIVIAVC